MPLVAKRKVRQTWREALTARLGPQATAGLARFDGLCADGLDEAEAAFRVLEAERLLWLVDEPGAASPTQAPPGEVPAV